MKKEFFDTMFQRMNADERLYLIFCGLGYPRYEEFKEQFGDRAINTEASEQTALDIAVGLTYAGKIPFVYTITPFFLRGYETIRTYINKEQLPVQMVGAGRGDDYSKHDGFSHEAGDIGRFIDPFIWVIQYYPETVQEMQENIDSMIQSELPSFLSVRK